MEDNKEINIEIPFKPIPASRPRIKRVGRKSISYYNEPYNSHKKLLSKFFDDWVGEREKPLIAQGKSVIVHITFFIEIPKSLSQKKKNLLKFKSHVKKPDIDNLVKTVFDAMNGSVLADDSQVSTLIASKYYSDEPKIVVSICEK